MKQDIRSALENPDTLKLIKSLLTKRGFSGNQDVLDTLVTDTVIRLLEREDYYNNQYKYGLGSFLGQVITTVTERLFRNPDSLDGDVVYLDSPVTGEEVDGEYMTIHDLFSEEQVFADPPSFITQAGVPERMTYYLSQLTDRQSECFILRYVYGYTVTETAELLGVSEDTVKYHIKEARRELLVLKQSEDAYEAKLEIGNVCGRIISNNESSAGVWADWSWKESHAEPSPVKVYTPDERAKYAEKHGLNYI